MTGTTTPERTEVGTGVATFNRRRRGILGGAILIAVGLTYLLPSVGVPDVRRD